MSKRATRPHSPDSSPLLSETADVERGARRGGAGAADEGKPWDVVPPPSAARRGQGSKVFRSVMLVVIAVLAVLLLGVRAVLPVHGDGRTIFAGFREYKLLSVSRPDRRLPPRHV